MSKERLANDMQMIQFPETDRQALAKRLVMELKTRGWHISCAESLTGGMLAEAITDIPGASSVLAVSFVTYAEEAKEKFVGVKAETLKKYGVVSEEVALEMAEGVRRVSGADIGIGLTGVAGPDGGTVECPVGTLCFSVSTEMKNITETVCFGDIGRNHVREASVYIALQTLCEILS